MHGSGRQVNAAQAAPVGIFLVGAQRCGTTAWFDYLAAHPGIAALRRKEPSYFAPDLPFPARVTSLADYHALRSPDPEGTPRRGLDGSTCYLFSEVAAAAIHAYNPAAHIVILLRRPEEFLPSVHALLRLRGYETAPHFEDGWRLEEPRSRGLPLPGRCPHPVLLRYRYMARLGEQLARYTARFPPEQIAVMDFDDWRRDPGRAYRALLGFLGLPDDGRQHFERVNESVRWRSPRLEDVLRSKHRAASLFRGLLRRLPAPGGRNGIEQLRRLNRIAIRTPPLNALLAAEVRDTLAEDQALLDRLAGPLRILRH